MIRRLAVRLLRAVAWLTFNTLIFTSALFSAILAGGLWGQGDHAYSLLCGITGLCLVSVAVYAERVVFDGIDAIPLD